MKKALVIIMSVAILGVLGMYINNAPSKAGGLIKAPSANQAAASSTLGSSTSSATQPSATTYKDGTYNGSSDTPYGTVSIAVVINGGKITDVKFLQMPNDQGHSQEVTYYAEPLLKQTTLSKQSANIDFVSGATSTSYGYESSLQAALDKAVQA